LPLVASSFIVAFFLRLLFLLDNLLSFIYP
jgi:hypothetical protein